MSLRTALSTPAGKAPYVRGLFAAIADRYDLITVVLSYGQDARWKRRLVAMAGPLAGRRVLDVASGTGDLALLASAAGADVIALDVTPRMIGLARAKAARYGRRPLFLVGDMGALPLPDACVDVVTTGYGLRNAADLDGALAEIRRVLRPGGRLWSLDFTRPRFAPVRAAWHLYLTAAGGALGWLLHRNPDTYRYIPESLRLFPAAGPLCRRLEQAGFRRAGWRRVLGGLLAIHHAERV